MYPSTAKVNFISKLKANPVLKHADKLIQHLTENQNGRSINSVSPALSTTTHAKAMDWLDKDS